MSTIKELTDDFLSKERPVGVMLAPEIVLAQNIAAVRFYASYEGLEEHDYKRKPISKITEETEINISEWGIIRPLFLLYVEREQALYLEASRGLGVDVFGRSVSEIQSEIAQKESEMSLLAFFEPVICGIEDDEDEEDEDEEEASDEAEDSSSEETETSKDGESGTETSKAEADKDKTG